MLNGLKDFDGSEDYFIADKTAIAYNGHMSEWCLVHYCAPRNGSGPAINGVKPLLLNSKLWQWKAGFRPIIILNESVTTEDVPVIGATY